MALNIDVQNAILAYFQLINNEEFIKFVKEFAERMQQGIAEKYVAQSKGRQVTKPEIVEIIESIIKEVKGIKRI